MDVKELTILCIDSQDEKKVNDFHLQITLSAVNGVGVRKIDDENGETEDSENTDREPTGSTPPIAKMYFKFAHSDDFDHPIP